MRFNDRGLSRGLGLVTTLTTGLALLAMAMPAGAQENLDQGKSAQQLFASDCAICHKSPQGLAKRGGGLFGLDGFLREHYTASRETASLLSKYLESVGDAPAEPTKGGRRSAKPASAKPAAGAKSADKPSEVKSGESKPEPKPEAKPETKSAPKSEAEVEPKAEPKSEAKPEAKTEAKAEPKAEPKAESKPEPKAETAAKPAAEKSDKSE